MAHDTITLVPGHDDLRLREGTSDNGLPYWMCERRVDGEWEPFAGSPDWHDAWCMVQNP